MKTAYGVLAAATASALVFAIPPVVAQRPVATPFVMADRGAAVPIFVDDAEFEVARIATRMMADDVMSVAGVKPSISGGQPVGRTVVVIGTLGRSAAVDDLARRGLVDAAALAGQWEAYRVSEVRVPWPGVDRALVIAGSDRRGTAYGALSLSRPMGVSPWTWWSDVAPAKRDRIAILPDKSVIKPSVQYRGIFINDEDWSLRPWAESTYDKERGNIGPKTYERVFELLLRLRANLLWPGMHPGTLAFNQDPRNAELADRYAVVMGSAHSEPMLRANVAEWDENRFGPWNFEVNGERITRYWDDRVKSNGRFENMYTIGMRGVHDTPVLASAATDQVKLLENIIDIQRGLLKNHVAPDPAKVPQIFIPYKEVLDTYRKGLKLPDDITLGWVDDNFSYIRQLSTPDEQKRSGGAGVYYHVSYWGVPTEYLWLATTPPALIAAEMSRAWDTNARKVWIVNVGDIKPSEVDAEYFLDLAWDYGTVLGQSQPAYLTDWARRTFGPDQAQAIGGVLHDFYRLGFIRKPEHMNFSRTDVGVHPSEFSPVSYGDEASRRLADYGDLVARAEAIGKALPDAQQDAYYELVLYPVLGSSGMAHKALYADRSYLAAWQGRASANALAARSAEALAGVKAATQRYNGVANGKWRDFMNDDPRDQAVFAGFPTGAATPMTTPGLGIAVEGSVDAIANRPARASADYTDQVAGWRTAGAKRDTLPSFDPATRTARFIDVFNTGTGALSYAASTDAPWITLSERGGSLDQDRRLWVNVDWAKVPVGTTTGTVTVTAGSDSYRVTVPLDRDPALRVAPGTLVASDGVVAIEAERFSARHAVNGRGWQAVADLGRSGGALVADALVSSVPGIAEAPYVDYEFAGGRAGPAELTVDALPTFPLDRNRKLRYAVSIDGAPAQVVDIDADRPWEAWETDIVRNARYTKTRWTLGAGRTHRIRLWALDPALVVDRLVLNLGGVRTAYLGPPETRAPR